MQIKIRLETKQDTLEVYELVKDSFATASHSDGDEPNFVNRLRQSPEFIPELCLVAEENHQIIGHIMFSKVFINGEDQKVLILAPVAVAKQYQNKGIGRQLIIEGHKRAQQMGYHLIILVGHEHYYPRFGYVQAKQWGLNLPFEVPSEVFMVKELTKGKLGSIQGLATFSEAFNPVKEG